MEIDGRTLNHETLEHIRLMAARRVRAGEKPSAVIASYGLCRTDIYWWLRAALGFGAAAWTVAPRDRFIGWTAHQRKRNLHLVVNNARFLILPWVRVKNLASHILARAAHQIPHDLEDRYGFDPVLLETFVDTQRFRGACYRAANWRHVGQTQGRGKLNKTQLRLEPIKDIFLYPLNPRFRHALRQTR